MVRSLRNGARKSPLCQTPAPPLVPLPAQREEAVINIISTQTTSGVVTGPAKVYRNLVKGLEAIGYPYVVNRSLNSTKRVWVHDDVVALRYVARCPAKAVVGPNLYLLPRDIPPKTDLCGVLYLHPCRWAVSVWRAAGFTACDMAAWPVGIDLDEFRPGVKLAGNREILVYHKERGEHELKRILASLERASLRYRVIRYGSYAEGDYMEALRHSGLVVWHGRHESQGIALQEALAMDVPVLLCDVTRLSEGVGGRFPPELDEVPVTAAPYFDSTCGIRASGLDGVGALAGDMLLQRSDFAPREYIQANLSLEGQARRFVALWEYFGLSVEAGYGEQARSSGEWAEPLSARLSARAARFATGAHRRLRHGREIVVSRFARE